MVSNNTSRRLGEKCYGLQYLSKKGENTLLRGTILNRTYGEYKNLYISLILLTIFGPIYYGPPYYQVVVLPAMLGNFVLEEPHSTQMFLS